MRNSQKIRAGIVFLAKNLVIVLIAKFIAEVLIDRWPMYEGLIDKCGVIFGLVVLAFWAMSPVVKAFMPEWFYWPLLAIGFLVLVFVPPRIIGLCAARTILLDLLARAKELKLRGARWGSALAIKATSEISDLSQVNGYNECPAHPR